MSENVKRCPHCGRIIDTLEEDNITRVIELLMEARDVLGLTVAELKDENRSLKKAREILSIAVANLKEENQRLKKELAIARGTK